MYVAIIMKPAFPFWKSIDASSLSNDQERGREGEESQIAIKDEIISHDDPCFSIVDASSLNLAIKSVLASSRTIL